MYIIALFTTAKNWKKSKGPPTWEWIWKLCYIHTIDYYSQIKKNNELNNMDESYRYYDKHKRVHTIYMIPSTWRSRGDKSM